MPVGKVEKFEFARFTKAVSKAAKSGGCTNRDYTKRKVPSFSAGGEMIAFCSPDSTYAATKRLLDAAKTSIRIGIYDFTATYVRDLLLDAITRGVAVELMLDLRGPDEKAVFEHLEERGVSTVRAPSCTHAGNRYFPHVHEKVIVVDGTWTFVQSGNYSRNSIPRNEVDGGSTPFVTGNRDVGVAFKSKPMARWFSDLIAADRKLATGKAAKAALLALAPPLAAPALHVKAPKKQPVKTHPSKSFDPASPIKLQPVLTPDNYMEVVPSLLAGAKRSILVEQQYVRTGSASVGRLLDAIGSAMDSYPDLDVRFVLGKAFNPGDEKRIADAIADLKSRLGLKLGTHVRFVDQTRLVHCHAKLIVVDEAQALVGSQNWSETAVATNREASVLVPHAPLARYFVGVFETDWTSGVLSPTGKPKVVPTKAFAKGNVIPIDAGDYVEV